MLRWDYPGEPPEGTPQAEAGTATHTYLEAHDGIHNVSVTDATNPARAQIVAIQTPDFIPIGG